MRELRPEELRRRCDPDIFNFETTEELEPLDEIIGQERAMRALELGLAIKDFRYNIYVAGGPGLGKTSIVKAFLEKVSAKEKTPPDLCYVHNFEDPYTPKYLQLPPGWGCQLKEDMKKLVEMLKKDIPTAFQSEEYQKRKQQIDEEFNEARNRLFLELEGAAEKKGFVLQRTPVGIKTIPVLEGKPLTEERYRKLTPEERERIEKLQEEVQLMIQEAIGKVGRIEEERMKEIEKLNKDVASFTIHPRIAKLKEKYQEHSRVIEFLDGVGGDMLANIEDFMEGERKQVLPMPEALDKFRKYDVNVLVDCSKTKGAPVVVQDNATYPNLFGKVERRVQFGVMTADFTMIKPGALHEANGGYLVLNADNLFRYWISWEALKIALRSKKIQIEDPASMLGFTATEGLKPEPVPLDIKVIIIGNPLIYQLLQLYDEDFRTLFNVKSDFDDLMDWKEEYVKKFGPFIKARCEERGIKPFHKSGVARVVEYASEITGDQKKLSARFSDIMTIIREASYWAEQDGSPYVTAEHVEKAIEEKIYRSNMIEEKISEMIERGDILVDTEGEVIGQVNGLSVYELGDFTFGRPSRITANVYAGKEGVVNIEREAELSGKIHTKGLMILKGWLGEKFAYDKPLSLSASIAFEQSYAKVEGDSASSTELYAIISALAGVPLKQGIAVTGSVNQKGELQPVGGINEKIEGFYKVCKLKGLNGQQGVIIPEQNINNLMLKKEIIDAVKKGKFHIWAVKNIDEGIELLTGQRAGARLDSKEFEKDTVYWKADQRIREINKVLSKSAEEEEEEE